MASTSVLLAPSPLLAGISGRYFENDDVAPEVEERSPTLGRGGGVAPYALDPEDAERLRETATRLLQS